MAIDSSGINSLLAAIPHYTNLPRVEKDARALLSTYSSLKANVSYFDYKSQRIKMFYLYGTIPIVYNGVVYHIPVTFFFDPPYPDWAPRCFVTPTQTMQIKPNHRWVDSNGVIFHPYLSNWNNKSSNLVTVVREFIEVFNLDPPVYAISPQSIPPHAQTLPTYPPAASDYAQDISSYAQSTPFSSQSVPNYPQSTFTHPNFTPMYHPAASKYSNMQSSSSSPLPGNLNRPSNSSPNYFVTADSSPSGMMEYAMQSREANAVPGKDSTMREVQLVAQQINSSWDVFMAPLVAEQNIQKRIQDETASRKAQLTTEIVHRRDNLALIQKDKLLFDSTEALLKTFVKEESEKTINLKPLIVIGNKLSEQLLDLTAEIAAREDLVSRYDEALRYGTVDSHEYLLSLRENFRENHLALQLRTKIIQMKSNVKEDVTVAAVS